MNRYYVFWATRTTLCLFALLLCALPVFASEKPLPPFAQNQLALSAAQPPEGNRTTTLAQKGKNTTQADWENLAPGLDKIELDDADQNSTRQQPVRIAALRMNPNEYDLELYSTAWEEAGPFSLTQWASRHKLVAAINAGMYLPNGHTHTAFMRKGTQINNGRVAEKYGSFFVSGPREPGLPLAAVLDRATDDWQKLLPLYDNVVQNFRLLGPKQEQLWPEDGPRHSIAAVAADSAGRILFLHCRTAITVHRFVRALQALPKLDIVAAMYVEGGVQAAMFAHTPGRDYLWTGQNPMDILLGPINAEMPLPNIIGVRPRGQKR